ncbi:uncharacterized protein LOC133917153 isoform X2 [Phragmites australis]|uniref:uncharacterized protein LOC133917153 isoform X2 n=1 Tax=Phragmites australis TaxID=29695 RepID=UPI002D76C6EA|nr:uncharacterized protein LOC133917153 isoform X2 [Phragmites australis]
MTLFLSSSSLSTGGCTNGWMVKDPRPPPPPLRQQPKQTPPRSPSSRLLTSFSPKADIHIDMVKAIRIHDLGGPEVMQWEEVQLGNPKEGEIRIRTTAIGVNFIDVYFRKGVYSAPALPFTPGMEAVGVVTAVGPGLTGRKVGDVVAYAGNPMGSYSEEQILPASVAVTVPPSVDHKAAASVMLKGMTAHVLVRRVFQVESGHTVLVHAAAGGVGSLLCQWANALGATVIGTVSNEEKAAQATQDGCHHVIIYTKEDVVTRVKEITAGNGVNVVYDSVGKDTYKCRLLWNAWPPEVSWCRLGSPRVYLIQFR